MKPETIERLRAWLEYAPTTEPDDDDYDDMESAWLAGANSTAWTLAKIVRDVLTEVEADAVHHICIGGTPWCDWAGTIAGMDKVKSMTPKQRADVWCQHPTRASAERAAAALRPFFREGTVHIVCGKCPHA